MSNRQTQSAPTVRPLDKGGFIPLYFQIQQALMEKIHAGELSEGDSLASEEELARIYQVSRMTARQALHGLKTKGYAFSQKGRGTFVSRPKLEKNIMHLRGFTEDMKHLGMAPSSKLLEQIIVPATADLAEKLKVEVDETIMHLRGFTEDMKHLGMAPSSKLLEQTIVPATADLAEKLKVEVDETIMRLRRLRLADGIPMALEDSHIPLKRFPGLDKINFGKESLYFILRENFGVRVAYADEVIEALPATREDSELLTIPRRASILSITRIIITTEEIPIEAASSRYRGDRYRASIRVPTTTIE